MDLECVLHAVLYVEISEIHEHLFLVCILGIDVLLFLILRRCVVVQRGDCRDLQERIRIIALMDGYFEYSQTGHMKRLSW